MKKKILSLVLLVSMILQFLPMASFADPVIPSTISGLEAIPDPIDPQSWTLLRDTNWADYKPNPAIDWMTEHNPASLYNPSRHAGEQDRRNTKIKGAIIMIDFWDRPFLMLGEKGTDLFGWHTNDDYGTYQDYLNKIDSGAPVTYNPQRVVKDEQELKEFWVEYLNKKIEDETMNTFNHGSNVDEFWREVSYGKWGVDLEAFGVFHLEGFEMEYGLDYTSWADLPPTFRRGASGSTGQKNFMTDCIAAANANDVWLGDYDFFFVCHSGYDESGVWMEFGTLQWAEGKDVPYEYGVQAKMDEIEEIFTEHPEYILALDTRGGYNQSTTIRDEAAKVRAHQEAGTLSSYKFKFPDAEWEWAKNYIGGGPTSSKPGTAGGPHTAPTRYVAWTSWAAAATRWASSSGYNGTTVTNSKGERVNNVPYSQQAECNGMATYAHEFGHVVSLSDNYSNSYGATYSPDTEPWDLMARGCFAGPFGDHARWSVPGGLEADSVPVHMMFLSKKLSGFYDAGDVYALSVADLKAGTPVVENVVARNIPLAGEHYPWLADYGLVSPKVYKAIELTFDSANPDKVVRQTTGFTWSRIAAGRMSVEVVQRTGYDSFAPDDGVVLSRLATGTGQAHTVIDSHLYNLDMVDYYLNGVAVPYTMGNQAQLFDGAFKAGISSVDTGYYVGGEFKGDKRGSDEVISGDTVNEFHDVANGLHFYILEKNLTAAKYGEVLSYSVALLHDDGQPVGGELVVTKGDLTPATPGRVAVQEFKVKNTGAATDIVRITLGGTLGWEPVILNNLFAIDAGEEITVPVYVEVPENLGKVANESLIFTASSESNGAKVASVTMENFAETASVLAIDLSLNKFYLNANEEFEVTASLTKQLNSNVVALRVIVPKQFAEYKEIMTPAGVTLLNKVERELVGFTYQYTELTLTLMVQDYNMQDLVTIKYLALQDITEELLNRDPENDSATELVSVFGQFVVMGDAEKEVITLQSGLNYLPPDPISNFNLIYLSNVIDLFGKTSKDADWTNIRKYDFNQDKKIDIWDITFVASQLVLN